MKAETASKFARLAALVTAIFVSGSAASAATCDRGCLLEKAKQFNAAMLGHVPGKIQVASDVRIRENTKAIALADSKWMGVTKILSQGVYADPTLGNVIEHVTAQTADAKAVYIGTRLKVVDGKIREVEINFDDSDRVNVKKKPRGIPRGSCLRALVPPCAAIRTDS